MFLRHSRSRTSSSKKLHSHPLSETQQTASSVKLAKVYCGTSELFLLVWPVSKSETLSSPEVFQVSQMPGCFHPRPDQSPPVPLMAENNGFLSNSPVRHILSPYHFCFTVGIHWRLVRSQLTINAVSIS